MDKEKLQDLIDEVVMRTFKTMTNLYKKTGKVDTLLIFPDYTRGGQAGNTRVSEQELRQLFIEELTHYVKEHGVELHYSVESPTEDGYCFKEDQPHRCDDGRAGRFDLIIWEDKKVALIEFKSATAEEQEYLKDLCKLTNEIEGSSDVLRYFINIFEGANAKTVNRVKEILNDGKMNHIPVYLRFHSMNNPTIDNNFPTKYPIAL